METKLEDEKKAWLEINSRENGKTDLPRRNKKAGRSTLEKVLLVVVAVLFLALIAVVIVLIITKIGDGKQQSPSKESEVCVTKECVAAAARINSYIDYSVPYCDNFYQFACGRWMKENVIPSDKSSLSPFGILRDQVDVVLKNLLEQPVAPTDLGSIKKAKDVYTSCMNVDLINFRGDQPFRDLLSIEFGGWPLVTEDWSEESFDLMQILLKLNAHGHYPVIAFFVGVDYKNSSKHVFTMDQTRFGMPGQKYFLVPRNETMLKSYEELIFQVGQLLGFANGSTAREEVAGIVDFEILLANISVPDESRRDTNTLYNPMTLAEVNGNYSKVFDWRAYVHSLVSHPKVRLTDITDEEIVINQSPLYYERLNELLKDTPKRTLANYLMWRLVKGFLHSMGDKYNEHLLDYRKALFGTSVERPRFRICVEFTSTAVALALGRMFIKDNFDVDSKNVALEMIRGLQDSFNELLDNSDWMDDDTKIVARDKSEHMSPKIGYPDDITNDTFLEEYYANFTFHKDQYFENTLMILRESFLQNLRKLRETVDKTKWENPPQTVNAFYSSLKNHILFPAGILQPPFFSKSFPMSMNFGGIGYFIGHEITHGFDDKGRLYDKYGNLVQWWSQTAVEKFKDKTKCIVDQYGNFTVPEVNLKLNGINTQGENIADNGGLKQSFKAYRKWVSKQGKEELLLPGLDFNHNQLFFINFAQLWCSLMTEGDALSRIKTGVHSPGRFRVIGSTQNSPDFAQAFMCPVNSYMNPREKCTVW